jgi:anti-sigma B factor antagonist
VAEQLSVLVVPDDGRVTLRLHGEVDIASVARLQACLDGAAGTWPVVEIDASGLTFLDSSGVAALALAHRRLNASGVELRVRNPSPFVTRVLQITGLTDLLDVVGERALSPLFG